MRNLKKLFVLASLLATIAKADFAQFEITTNFYGYEDTTTSCSHEYWISSVDLTLYVKDGKVHRAALRSLLGLGSLFPEKVIEFSGSELNGFEVEKNSLGKYWIKVLPLSGRLLRWVMYETRSMYCSPPYYSGQLLATTAPTALTYHFETIPKPPETRTFSETLGFSGYRQDGVFYRAKLGFAQQQKTSGPPFLGQLSREGDSTRRPLPWTEIVNVTRTSFSEGSARSLAESAIQTAVGQKRGVCSSDQGKFSSYGGAISCSKVGSQYTCQGTTTCVCNK